MLPGQPVQNAVEDEAFGFDFGARFRDAHFVLLADGDSRVFLAELDEDEAAARLERFADAAQHLLRVGELVVDIDEQGEVERLGRQAGIGFRAEDGFHIGEAFAADAFFQQPDHFGLDVSGEDSAGGTDGVGEELSVVARSGADVSDGLAGLKAQELDGQGGALFDLALGALEPRGAGGAHDGSDDAAADRVAQRLGGAGGGKKQKKRGGQLRGSAGFDMFHTDTDSEATGMYSPIRMMIQVTAAAGLLFACACGNRGAEAVHPMGTPVAAGELTYTVYNTEWREELQTDMGPRKPQHRFLLVTASITNNSPEDLTAPLLVVIDKDGRETLELDKGEGVAQWMGLLRRVRSTQTETGVLLFDVPPGDYKLRVSSGGDVEHEKTALISLPYRVEAPVGNQPVEPQMPAAQ